MVRSSLEDSTDLPCRLPDQAYAGHAHRRHLDHERRGASSQLIRCNAHCVAQERVTTFFVNLEARDAVCWNDRKASGTMNAHLSFAQIALLIAYAGGMAGGQVLFKMASLRGVADGPVVERLFSMMLNGFFAAAVLLYAALTVLWFGY